MVPVVSIGINAIIAVVSVAAWLSMARVRDHAAKSLASAGFESLKYFTVLSNLFSGVVSAAYLIGILAGGGMPAQPFILLKLMAGSAVMVTFLTVVLFLGPTMGWTYMFVGGNLWMHLILPLLAALDCCLFVPLGSLPFAQTFCAIIFTALYAAGYIRMVLAHRHKDGDRDYDFYGFTRWGFDKIPVVASVMILATWVVALLLWSLSKVLCPVVV